MITWESAGVWSWNGRIGDVLSVNVFHRTTGWWYRFRGNRPWGPFGTSEEAKAAAEQSLVPEE